jgi:sensor histidine kinase regulating citrate/malate metabolism
MNLKDYGQYKLIEIEDFGTGIPPELLEILGVERIQSPKHKGQGIALFEAQRKIRAWGGALEIRTKKSGGTIIQIFLRAG